MPPLSDVATVLAVNFALCVAGFLILWRVGVAIRDVSFIDAVWAFGMGGVALATYVQAGEGQPRQLVLVALCLAWALRLGLHLFLRWRKHGADRRYVRMLDKAQSERGWSYGRAALVLVFALQAPLMWLVSLPVQLGQLSDGPAPIGLVGAIGAVICLVGIAFETIGDAQITAFKADPANAGKVMDRGLWRYTRHPNYFGDICAWTGLFLVAAEAPLGLWALPGPAILIFLLTRFSGGNIYERRLTKSRPGYDDYQRRTSPLIPWPPKRARVQGQEA